MSIFRVLKKYKRLLTKKQWGRLFPLFILMLVAGGMETLSVSMIMPFMDMVMNPTRIRGKWYVLMIENISGRNDTKYILATIAFVMALIYIVKNVYIIWELRIQQRFVYRSMFDTQKELISTLISKPYDFFLKVKSGNVLTMIYNHVTASFGLLSQLLYMFSELVVAGMLVMTLFLISPVISVLMGLVLFIIMLIISKCIKPAMRKAADDNNTSSQSLYKWILQSIQGIKEVKIMGVEEYFIENYKQAGEVYVEALCSYNILNNIPRTVIEATTMAGFFGTIGLFILTGQNIGNMFPVIAVIAMAAMRLLPAANRISTAMASIAYTEGYIDELLSFRDNAVYGIKSENKGGGNTEGDGVFNGFKNKICVDNVAFSYPNSDVAVLKAASFSITKGDTVGIVGESGAGKTTLIDIMMGLLVPDSGKIMVDSVDIHSNISRWIADIGYIPQTIFMLDDSIRHNVAFGVREEEIDDENIWKALEEAALGDFVRGLPEGLDTQIGERGMRLSGGQRQRIGIARALYWSPHILFFDEATSALDNDTEKEIMESINGLKGYKTMVIIAHRLTTIESCDHIYRVEDGKVIQER